MEKLDQRLQVWGDAGMCNGTYMCRHKSIASSAYINTSMRLASNFFYLTFSLRPYMVVEKKNQITFPKVSDESSPHNLWTLLGREYTKIACIEIHWRIRNLSFASRNVGI